MCAASQGARFRADGSHESVGYRSLRYAQALEEVGASRALVRSGAWILERTIPSSEGRDAMGCYPLFACRDWSSLEADLDELEGDLASIAVVTDPFGEYDEALLRRTFRDRVVPFKSHYVADLAVPPEKIASKHHRYYARKAMAQVEVESCPEPQRFADEWLALYAHLVERHGITGIPAFSPESLVRQLEVPGLVALRAVESGETVAMHLWMLDGGVAYSHLAASSERGYGLMASYALYWTALEEFSRGARWLHVGAGAGLEAGKTKGLDRFKRGWATGTRTVYFCGRILDPEGYEQAVRDRGVGDTGYFPAYRVGEFG